VLFRTSSSEAWGGAAKLRGAAGGARQPRHHLVAGPGRRAARDGRRRRGLPCHRVRAGASGHGRSGPDLCAGSTGAGRRSPRMGSVRRHRRDDRRAREGRRLGRERGVGPEGRGGSRATGPSRPAPRGPGGARARRAADARAGRHQSAAHRHGRPGRGRARAAAAGAGGLRVLRPGHAGPGCRPDAGYRLGEVRAFDLFPQTAHVETVAVLDLAS
jgi:SAM-dependent methyltransferases related to tRNA (uracil-5-)-methyltransferase